MISYLKRHELDEDKYNSCIKLSINSRIYAYSWYLDIVADNWDVLVLNNYEAVMPLPWRSKYFIKYIYPPAWIQQLGVFSESEIDDSLIQEFIHSIPNKFKKVTIQFNVGNDISLKKTTKRVNYILPLNKTYEEIYKGYRTDRKNRVNQAKRNELIIKNCSFVELENIAKVDYSFINIKESNYKKLKFLTTYIQNNNSGFILGVYKDQILLGGAIFLKDNERINYLFSVVTSQGKKQQATSMLINNVINKYSNSRYIFDFEGSMIPGIASFFKSFGAEQESYFLYQKPFRLF